MRQWLLHGCMSPSSVHVPWGCPPPVPLDMQTRNWSFIGPQRASCSPSGSETKMCYNRRPGGGYSCTVGLGHGRRREAWGGRYGRQQQVSVSPFIVETIYSLGQQNGLQPRPTDVEFRCQAVFRRDTAVFLAVRPGEQSVLV